MNIASAMEPSGAGRALGAAIAALRGITWPQVRGAMLFGLGVWVFTLVTEPMFRIFAKTTPWHLVVLHGLAGFEIKALCLLIALVIADRAVDGGASRRSAYIAAALGGCAAGVLISSTIFIWTWRAFVSSWPEVWPPPVRPWLSARTLYYAPIYVLASWLLIGGSAVFLYADRRAARRTEAYLNAAELDRLRRSKIAVESRLQALQARVEPQFLFNTLAQVERLYQLDTAKAGRMLDDLIAYLRAAMPLMRDTSSTVGQEIDLARAYLDIVSVGLGESLRFDLDVPDGVRDVRMPPMMLLPLINHAIVPGLERSTATRSIRIGTEVRDGRLRLTIADTDAGFGPRADSDGIASIRERLTALYGDSARLDLRQLHDGATEATMEIPCEAAVISAAVASGASADRPAKTFS